jgi:hypothetical protein
MAAPAETPKGRCIHCRTEIAVPDNYAHGTHIKCGTCRTEHKVVRGGEKLRLVLADTGPLREALAQNEAMIERLEAELAHARGSFGLGANGIGIAVAYALYQLAFKEATLSMGLLWSAVAVAVVSGALLEAANYLFFAKRLAILRISDHIREAQSEGAELRQKLREATRV